MSTQNNLEEIIKKIHLMVSQSPHVKGDPNRVVIDKNELFSYMEDISRCMYDMLDEYKLTSEQKKEQLRQIKEEQKKMVESASKTVEDMYSASALYTDGAIGRLVRILEESQKSFDILYAEYNRRMSEEKARLRGNQKVLEEQLFEMKDSNFYVNLLADARRKMEKEYEENQTVLSKKTFGEGNYPQPEIKINQAYFDQMGLNLDGTKKVEEINTEAASAPEVVVNMNSNYFKWKNGEKIDDPLVNRKEEKDESGE